MDALTLFGLVSVILMLVCLSLEKRSPWFALGLAASSLLGSAYGFLQGAWPLGLFGIFWAAAALQRWMTTRAPADRQMA